MPTRLATNRTVPSIALRAVRDADLPILFEHQREPEANQMAALPARDWPAFVAHSTKIQADPTNVRRTILADGEVAGSIGSWVQDGEREVGYWIGHSFWAVASRRRRWPRFCTW
jgi:RimJ/RimL family protein N-acetyltransferase